VRHLGWFDIFRLGLVQAGIGAIVVLTTSTLNRIMVVELALPASLSGALVALYYLVQLTRPNWGWRSDAGGARSPWILGGVAALALGGLLATFGVMLLPRSLAGGLAVSIAAYVVIGAGVSAAGTSLLALLGTSTHPDRRAAAATITWLMMIAGIALTAAGVGRALEPYSPARLLWIVTALGAGVTLLTALAIWGIERRLEPASGPARAQGFRAAMAEVWADARARLFAIFVFLSMVAYFMQELILEPFAGHVFGFTPGQSTTLAGLQNGGVFAGMLTVGAVASGLRIGSLRLWTAGGCLGSAAALAAVAGVGLSGPGAPLLPAVFALGYFNGVFAVAAIGSMMQLAGEGGGGQEGARMGLWGAAQAIAAGFGGFLGAASVDAMRLVLPREADAYGAVFLAEAALFLLAAGLALRAVASPLARPVPGQ
jgi:BCD family chlorophyll transporter-like MFS transporter